MPRKEGWKGGLKAPEPLNANGDDLIISPLIGLPREVEAAAAVDISCSKSKAEPLLNIPDNLPLSVVVVKDYYPLSVSGPDGKSVGDTITRQNP